MSDKQTCATLNNELKGVILRENYNYFLSLTKFQGGGKKR